MIDPLIDWLIDWSFGGLLIDWLIDWSVDCWSIDRLIDWLITLFLAQNRLKVCQRFLVLLYVSYLFSRECQTQNKVLLEEKLTTRNELQTLRQKLSAAELAWVKSLKIIPFLFFSWIFVWSDVLIELIKLTSVVQPQIWPAGHRTFRSSNWHWWHEATNCSWWKRNWRMAKKLGINCRLKLPF